MDSVFLLKVLAKLKFFNQKSLLSESFKKCGNYPLRSSIYGHRFIIVENYLLKIVF